MVYPIRTSSSPLTISPLEVTMFKQFTLVSLLSAFSFFPLAVFAQTAPASVVQAIQAIENDWAKAYLTKDGDILERILGEEFYCIWQGKRHSRQDEINATVTEKATYSSVTNTVVDVRQYEDMAIAVGEVQFEGTTPEGKPLQRAGLWQTVFANRDGRWVAVACYSAPLSE